MNIETHAIVFSGLDSELQYAAAISKGHSVWAVGNGNEAGAAMTVLNSLEELDSRGGILSDLTIDGEFEKMHSLMQRMNMVVSAAGAYSDGRQFHLFNIGNARVLAFEDGYLCCHTEDHSEAYRAYDAKGGSAAAYDRIRFQNNRQELWKALGFGSDFHPQWYAPVRLKKNTALLICTETFWRYISIIEMELDYRKSAGPEEWLRIMSKRVLMKAGHELDNDNFAAVSIVVEE